MKYYLYFLLDSTMYLKNEHEYRRILPKLVIMMATFSYIMFKIMMIIKLMMEAVMDVAVWGVRYFWIGSVSVKFVGSFEENTMNTESL